MSSLPDFMTAGISVAKLPPNGSAPADDDALAGEFIASGDDVPLPPPPPFEVGIFDDMPATTYHAIEAMSSGGVKKINQSPAHYRLMRTTRNVPTAAMQFGTAVHAGVLEPDTFHKVVAVAPDCDKRTKDGKAEWAQFAFDNAGRIILKADEFARAQRCIDAVRAHPAASRLLDGGRSEVSLFWNDGKYKVPCKCRWDKLNRGGGMDLKTTLDASPDGFGRQIASLQYHVAAAHYISGHEHVLNESPEFFAFIAVESEPPHAVACYVLPSNAILAGMRLVNEALARYAEALEAGKWKGYPDTIEAIQLPRWALKFEG